MLPHNGQRPPSQHQQAVPFLQGSPSHNGQEGSQFYSLDPSAAAKQMAALNAANLAKMTNRSAPGGTSVPFLGTSSINQPNLLSRPDASSSGHDPNSISNPTIPLFNLQAQPHHATSPPNNTIFPGTPDSQMTQPGLPPHANALMLQQQQQQKRRNFLQSLAHVHNVRNAPLPPALTGIPSANYDPSTSPWKALDISSNDVGVIRVAGRDVDLFRLWTAVNGAGGAQKVSSFIPYPLHGPSSVCLMVSFTKLTEQNGWSSILSYIGLPEQIPAPQSPQGHQFVAPMLAQYYMALFSAFDEIYKRNVQVQQQRGFMAAQAQSQGRGQQVGLMSGMNGQPSRMPQPGMGMPSQPGMPSHMNATPGGLPPNPGMNMMGMMGQQTNGPAASPPHQPSGGSMQFPLGQGMPHTPRQPSQPPQIGPSMQPPDTRPGLSTMMSSESLGGAAPAAVGLASQQLAGGLQTNGPLAASGSGLSQSLDVNFSADFDGDAEGRKRKMHAEEADGKRVRQKTVGLEDPELRSDPLPSTSTNSSAGMPVPPRARQQPSRRKIEYVPYRRELDTHGGRDLKLIEEELQRATRGRGIRDINEWGNVDIEALTMSLRSRLTMELSYALTTLTILSIMKGQSSSTGFPIYQCPDLVEEILDLLEDMAFDGKPENDDEDLPDDDVRIVTHRELVKMAASEGSQPFVALEPRQGAKDDSTGPRQRPGDIILTIVNIFRNLSMYADNHAFLTHSRLYGLLLRTCCLARPKKGSGISRLRPASPALSLSDLVVVRKDVLNILLGTAGLTHFAASSIPPTGQELRNARRTFDLLTSFLIDPTEAVTPMTWVLQAGEPPRGSPKPTHLVDVALDTFTRIALPDSNRQVLAQAVPQDCLWRLFEALIHRLPVTNEDYQQINRDPEMWLSYIEKALLALYCVAFMASPDMKKRAKSDRSLGFAKILMRLVKQFITWQDIPTRVWFTVSARRAVETMKIVDDGEDAFDTSNSSSTPVLAFGMGFADSGEVRIEKGTGLLGGYREEMLWSVMNQEGVRVDEIMFPELDSLTRVG
ncbi:hypothetical protein GLOTRDRAFT_118924 [Gloeophyllum trabeum ATCC 11539]|uniref:ARID domain-containing protein n=1 Tax=Gloeophyllum trabeum (strain ATCC 11539 / FP-39264 / Madison 617) TaxID=670483 RepID=S7QN48_GLOTA|nr:uncharacterized protein GLOTRDRAFT_118924 [Gloeophyllum trabeum ATCC 11539]EPQ60847.1 hypothetical protein GLOTRDRAFT_118924 [Gloeophyllum trabeum ATCC 11539]